MNGEKIDWHNHPSSAQALGYTNGNAAAALYSSPAEFERERAAIFRRTWLIVGREEEVAEPGDYLSRHIPTVGASVVIARGKDGIIRAFHNACSHRGVALVCAGRGKALTFRCPYHAWTYGIDGSLRAIPSEDDFPHVDKGANGLTPIAVDVWNGFIFLNFADDPGGSLREYLGEFGRLFDGLTFHDYPAMVRYEEEVSANWKLMINAFNEGYHIPFLHSRTLTPQLLTPDNPYLQYHDIRIFGVHSSITLQRNYGWQPAHPVSKFAIAHLLPTSVPDPDGQWGGLVGHPAVNAVNIPNFGTEGMTIFPNTFLQPLANGFLIFTFWPTAADRLVADVRVYSKKHPETLREEFAAANMLAATRDVLTEDVSMSQMQQKGLNSGARSRVFFGDNEAHLRFFSRAVASFM
jgi:phenylpropionate dioxygenase-like ring-hydroxylating dioxygenase large terminal subunit